MYVKCITEDYFLPYMCVYYIQASPSMFSMQFYLY